MKKKLEWVCATLLRIILSAAALAFQLPQVDDWVLKLIYPNARLLSQAVTGGAVHYIQTVAFGVACALLAEALLSMIGRFFGAVISRRKHTRKHSAAYERNVAV
ncbi:hypothetical protein FACS1894184_04250 [Clostridia bacterium]|nr:hypothetical protein FACS1894184_04250 [Clostridia bacterium]